ncbi:hypothetical protein ACWEQL_31745 [Kitasatospora sp. NPDC004240]
MRRVRSLLTAVALPVALVAALAAGCAAPAEPPRAEPAQAGPSEPAGRFERHGVAVSVTLEPGADGAGVLRATFTPTEPGFHLYSTALAPEGISGLGRPTALGARGALTADGPAVADKPLSLIRPEGLDVDLPVYPDGPVTLTLPVRTGGQGPAEAVVGYAACSLQRCLFPVTGQAITLTTAGQRR